MLRVSALALLSLGLVAQEPAQAAVQTPAKPSVQAPAPAAQAPAPKPAPAPDPDTIILAKVDGQPVTEADFRSAFQLLDQQQQMQLMMVQGGKDEFVRRMCESKLLAAKARRMGLDKTPSYIKGLERAKDDLAAREFLTKEGEALQKKLAIDDATVKAYYESHLDQFKQPDLVSVRHILISVKHGEGQPGLSDAEAKAKIAKIQAELKKGAKFEALAKKYSDDPGSKDKGGLYEDADPSGWVPEFSAAAKTQPLGKVGPAVKTQYGYHLVKVENRKPARQLTFVEAKASAEQMVKREREAAVWNELMESLKKEIPFEIMKAPAPTSSAASQPVPAPQSQEAPKGGSK